MRLEDLTIALRPRQTWEAADLGCALVRRDYGRLLGLWLLSATPVWLLLAALFWRWPLGFGLAAWWLKPLYGRLLLHHLSRAAFGSRPTLRQALREWPRLWWRHGLPSLLWRRLSMIRSFAMPVLLLEGQHGRKARARIRALALDGGSSGASVTWVFVKLELAVWLGLSALVSTVTPEASLPDWREWLQNPDVWMQVSPAAQWQGNLLYLAAMTLIEPFYVGAGFGLYLNSRTKLEGWDIELTFRRLAERLRPAAGLVLLALMLPLAGLAETPSDPKEIIAEVVKRPEFEEHWRTQRVWVPDQPARPDPTGLPYLAPLLQALGYATVALLAGLLVYWLVRNRHLLRRRPGPAHPPAPETAPGIVMGLEIDPASLPADIPGAAAEAWRQGRTREALSLLYRGSLGRLVEQQRLTIRDSDTEDDCLTRVGQSGDAGTCAFFTRLTRVWVGTAYAGRTASEEEFHQLCRDWPFDSAAAPRPAPRWSGTVALCLLLPVLAGCKGHWEEVQLPQGYRGKARSDPFLAAQMLLAELGHETRLQPALISWPSPQDGVLLLSAETGLPEVRSRQLLQWTRNGGHLIYALAGGTPYNDWSMFSSLSPPADSDRRDPVLAALAVRRESRPWTPETPPKKRDQPKPAPAQSSRREEPKDVRTQRTRLEWRKRVFQIELPSQTTLALARPLRADEFALGTPTKAGALSLRHGAGRITVLSHARPLRNRYLDEQDHARWLAELVGPEPRQVEFILAVQRNFWSLLWERAWMPLIGLAAIVLLWLWRNLPRFGPLRRVELYETRHFADHIASLGQFFHRLRRDDVLLGAAAESVRALALQRHPQLRSAPGDEALIEHLSRSSSLPSERIQRALSTTAGTSPHDLVQRLQDLQSLRQSLT